MTLFRCPANRLDISIVSFYCPFIGHTTEYIWQELGRRRESREAKDRTKRREIEETYIERWTAKG